MTEGRADIGVCALVAVYLDGLGNQFVQAVQIEKLGVFEFAVLRIAPGQFDKAA